MNMRNVIQLQVNIDADQVVSYEEGMSAIKEQEMVKKLNLHYLSSVNELVDFLELTRAAFERNVLENISIGTGVRHLNVIGDNFPRTRIYIDAMDLIQFLIEYCDLTYWKKEQIHSDKYCLSSFTGVNISKEDIEYLAQSLLNGRIKSNKRIEKEFNRTRPVISRLKNIIETITFSFPNSQRQLIRYVFSPSDNSEQVEDYFVHYKQYEKFVEKRS